jgi:hypothetical protein
MVGYDKHVSTVSLRTVLDRDFTYCSVLVYEEQRGDENKETCDHRGTLVIIQ